MTKKKVYGEVEKQVPILQRVFKWGLYCEVTPEQKANQGEAHIIQNSGGRTFRKRNDQVQRQ